MRVLGYSGFDRSVPFKRARFPGLARREYRVVQGLDSAVALVGNDGVEFAAAEERFSRAKSTGAFPIGAIRSCLEHAGLEPEAVDVVAHAFAYDCVASLFQHDEFSRAQYAEVYDPALQLQYLHEHFPGIDWASRFVAVPHHLAHAASAFYQSGFSDSLILVSDGMGETQSATVRRPASLLLADHGARETPARWYVHDSILRRRPDARGATDSPWHAASAHGALRATA